MFASLADLSPRLSEAGRPGYLRWMIPSA